jgi:hypothetical protein
MISNRWRNALVVGGVVVGAVGCAVAKPVAVTPSGAAVEVGKGDPPHGAKELGPIEAIHGHGCGGFGERGTYEGALAVLRNKAAEKGGDYVQIMTMDEPHSSGGCFDDDFVIRGMVFDLKAGPAAPVAAANAECSPPCSPGYACEASVCQALCNPLCSPGLICRPDRTCGAP